jgi:transposase
MIDPLAGFGAQIAAGYRKLTVPTFSGRDNRPGHDAPVEGVAIMGRYTKQFQEQAIKLVMQGQQPTVTARELGLPHSTLLQWLKRAGWRKPEPEGPVSEDPAVLAAQVKELRRQVKRLEMEKDILKKATGRGLALSWPTSRART